MKHPSLLLPALLLAASLQAGAQGMESAKVETITWLSGELPVDGDPKANLISRLLHLLREQWPQVRHEVLLANARRSWQMLAQGRTVCLSSALRTAERERLAYFTNTMLGPPQQLVVRKDKVAALPRNAAGEIDLARLLADKRFQGAVVDGRSYGDTIDALLAGRPKDAQLALYAASDFGSKILPMLSIGRADYSIGYETGLTLDQAKNPRLGTLMSLAIAGASQPMTAGVACPRTPWGLAAIRGVDKVLGTPAGAAMLREEGDRLLSPDARRQFAARLDAYYKERARPSVIR